MVWTFPICGDAVQIVQCPRHFLETDGDSTDRPDMRQLHDLPP